MSAQPKGSGRLTLSEIVTLLLSRPQGERSSVTLTRNAKGQTQIEVTVRTGDTDALLTAMDAERHAIEIYERLRAKYPLADGLTSHDRQGGA